MPFGINFRKPYRKLGDRKRDARDWGMAEQFYRQHLLRRPGDSAIWVQLGHVLREQGNLVAAESAYKQGATLSDDDADVFVHLAHAQKLLDKHDHAMATFLRAYDLKPDADLKMEIRRLKTKVGPASVQTLGSKTIAFSVHDLFGYLHTHQTMSGIQRVQAGIALHAIDDPNIDAKFIINDPSGDLPDGEFWMIDNEGLRDIIDHASGHQVDHARLRTMLTECSADAIRVRPGYGCTLILLGAFWGLANGVDPYITSKKYGARIGAYIYDIIPVIHPEYCEKILARHFKMALGDLCFFVDFILTISNFTQHSLKEFLADNGGRAIPMRTVPLAHELTVPHSTVPTWPNALQQLKGRPFVAYVSTIEGRKNHIYMVRAWQQMIADGFDVPDLIFVGRKGWRIEGLMDLLDETAHLNGRVHIVHDLSDGELSAIYAECLFTAFTSFVEGWGLPIGESLLHGRPCVASSTTSMPEVGGEFVDYINPYNLSDGVEKFKRMIFDHDYRDQRANNIRENFVRRTWNDVGNTFCSAVLDLKDFPTTPTSYVFLGEGDIVRPSDFMIGSEIDTADYIRNPRRLMTYETFYPPEPSGVWLHGNCGRLSFSTALEEEDDVIVYLEVFWGNWLTDCSALIHVEDRSQTGAPRVRAIALNDAKSGDFVRIKGKIGKAGICTVIFEIDGPILPVGEIPRTIALGVRAFAFSRSENHALRRGLMEKFIFRDLTTEW